MLGSKDWSLVMGRRRGGGATQIVERGGGGSFTHTKRGAEKVLAMLECWVGVGVGECTQL